MTSIDLPAPARSFDGLSKLLAILVVGLGLTIALVAELPLSPISCVHHQGDFSNGFSVDFNISSVDCRLSWMNNSPTIRFWGVSPYVGLKWGKAKS